MHLIAIGLNAGDAPLALRERLAFSTDVLTHALAMLQTAIKRAELAEAIILSTCHRLELYGVTDDLEMAQETLIRFLSVARDLPATEFLPHLIMRHDSPVADHLFRLAAGLESPVLGDSQILGQVSDAYHAAREAGTTGPVLAALFQRAMHAAKRVHSETTLNRRASVGYAGAAVALQSARTPHPTTLILGAGQMAQRAALYLHKHKAGRILIANRTTERARDLAARVNGEVVPWNNVANVLAEIDIVIAATSAPGAVVEESDVAAAMQARPARPLHCVDLAVPRDIEPSVGSLSNVRVSTVDDLATLVNTDRAKQQTEISRAEAIVAEGRADFDMWRTTRVVAPLISAMRGEAERIRTAEVHRFLHRDGAPATTEAERVDALTKAIVNKLLHHPTIRLKAMSTSPQYAAVASDLFGVDISD